jgi:hypothetical protein
VQHRFAGFHRDGSSLEKGLTGVVPHVRVIGDALATRKIKEAIEEGDRTVRNL